MLEEITVKHCPDCKERTIQKYLEVTKIDLDLNSIYVRYSCTVCTDVHEYYVIEDKDYVRSLYNMLENGKRLKEMLE